MKAAAAIGRSDHRIAILRQRVEEITGIQLPEAKNLMISSRLRKRMISNGVADLDSYLSLLFDQNNFERELPELVDLLTTNKTDFFREAPHFRFLSNTVIPEALERIERNSSARFRVWSAASSTGAEAWSAAMLLASAQKKDQRFNWAILGTDISRRVLKIANRAIYNASELDAVPKAFQDEFVMYDHSAKFQRGRIVPELRARVHFEEQNLMEFPYSISKELDVIFLRNVLIYFDATTQHRVISAVSSHLRSGGYFFVGHSESMSVRHETLLSISPGVFRKKGTSP